MRQLGRHAATAVLAVLTALTIPAAALAAPPANDDRATPAVLPALPAQVIGTTVAATRVDTDPLPTCAPAGPDVWYRFTAPAAGRIAITLAAAGDLDADVEAYRATRSQTQPVACDLTDAKGQGAVSFTVKQGEVYLVAVRALPNSVAGTFTLTVVAPQPAPRPPGTHLGRDGASGTLDRVGNPQDAYAVHMRAGVTYRLRLSGPDSDSPCQVAGLLYAPRTDSFDGPGAIDAFGCNARGYRTFTPSAGQTGTYSVLVSVSSRVRSLQPYHLQVGGAGPDDTAPGRFLGNFARTRGSLDGGGLDALDLYRFSVTQRSDLELKLAAADSSNFDVLLLNDGGGRIRCSCGDSGNQTLSLQIGPGRYFVAVRSRDASKGSYRLTRVSRLLTHTRITIAGSARSQATLGASLPIAVAVSPAVNGPVTVVIERFDPLSGWIFARQQRVRAGGGQATIAFRPPTVGRWRASASFDGTRGAGSSRSAFASVVVTTAADASPAT